MRFEVFIAVLMNIIVLWDVMPCSLEARYNKLGKPDASVLRMNSKPSEDSSSPSVSEPRSWRFRAIYQYHLSIFLCPVVLAGIEPSTSRRSLWLSSLRPGDECKAQARTIFGDPIEWVDTARYLGVTPDTQLT